MKIDHPAKRVLVTGGPGTGKTTLIHKLLTEQKARLKFVYDHEGEFSERYSIDPVFSAVELEEKTAKGGWVVYDPSNDFPDDFSKGLEFFCDYVLTISKNLKGLKLFYADELDTLTNNRTYPRSLVSLLQLGRRREVDCFFVSGQPNSIHNSVQAKITSVYTFAQVSTPSVEWLTKNGFSDEQVRGLGEHGWIYRNLRSGEVSSNLIENVQPAAIPASTPAKVTA